nr:reverse transcriptase domain-containing protein [Tanacetum cinerariifolium]
MPRECLAIIESKSKVRYSHNKPVVVKVSMNTSTFGISPDVDELKDMVKALLLDKKSQNQSHAPVKAVEESCVTYGVKAVEESCVTYGGAHSYRNCPATDSNVYRDNIQEFISQAFVVNYNQRNTSYRPPMIISSGNPTPFYDLIVLTTSPTLTLFENNDFLLEGVDAFLTIEDDPTFIEFYHPYLDPEGDILLLEVFLNNDPSLPPPNQGNYSPEVRKELKNYEAKSDKSSVNEPSAVELKDLTPYLEYAFLEELADRSISRPVKVAEDVYVKTEKDLIDVFKGELTLCVGKEAITFNLDQTSRYSANYSDMTAKRVDVIDMACEEYSQ